MKESFAQRYAHKYVEKLDRPLTEDDIARAYSRGSIVGRSSVWNKVAGTTPTCDPTDQIVVLIRTGKSSFDMKVVRGGQYAEFIADWNGDGTPVVWTYLSSLLGTILKQLKKKKDKSFLSC